MGTLNVEPFDVKAYNKAYYQKNKEKLKAYNRKRHTENRETIALKAKAYRDKNSETLLAKKRAYTSANKEVLKTRNEDWRSNNRAYITEANRRRKAHVKQATPKDVDLDHIRRFYIVAQFLKEHLNEDYHVDHIVPLRSKVVCGFHCPENLQLIPALDNLQKGNR